MDSAKASAERLLLRRFGSLDPHDDLATLRDREACACPTQELRRKKIADGRIIYVRQCTTCLKTGNAVSKDLANGREPFVEDVDWDHYYHKRMELLDGLRQHQQAAKDSAWWSRYTAYLQTPEWRAKRAMVLKRDNYRCAGCGLHRATQAHHLTYTHMGNEFLFELISICDDCHQRIHPQRELAKAGDY